MGRDQRMTDLWELPFLWISDTAQHCAFLPGLPLLLPLHCCQHSAGVFGACQARRRSGCVGKISVIMSIQLCLGFFNLLEKSQRHYSSTLGGAGPCYIFQGPIQSSSAVPGTQWWLLPWDHWEPSPSLHQVSVLPMSPAVPSEGWGMKEALLWCPPP